eukprot:scaffold27151_cov46-Attheya_sp.AAC.2
MNSSSHPSMCKSDTSTTSSSPFFLARIGSQFLTAVVVYLWMANRFRFQSNRPALSADAKINLELIPEAKEPWFARYMVTFFTVGLLLPLVTIFFGPKDLGLVSTPHVFVLWCQIIMETLTMEDPNVHNFIRLLVPIGFSVYRMRNLAIWCTACWELLSSKWEEGDEGNYWYYYWGMGLSVANLLGWTYNLFVMLLLRITPPFMEPERSPLAPVEWKGELIPILLQEPAVVAPTHQKES